MKRVLYLTNTEVPYRVRFFNKLAEHCNLTVLYERKRASSRDLKWSGSEDIKFNAKYLDGINIRNENSFSFKIVKEILSDYDEIIVGCYNSPVQILAMFFMQLIRKSYFINADGETFLSGNSMKMKLKRFIVSGAKGYLVAGEKSSESLGTHVKAPIYPYYFSSLSKDEVKRNSTINCNRNNTVLVVGQYVPEKGLNIAVEAAKQNSKIKYKFIGMGNKTDQFIKDYNVNDIENIQVIPFLQKDQLIQEFCECALFVLPSIKECWGLVINEAASFGTPIVSTWGSGSAVEFLADEYPMFLAKANSASGLYNCIQNALSQDTTEYSAYLKKKSMNYSIEKSVKVHIDALRLIM